MVGESLISRSMVRFSLALGALPMKITPVEDLGLTAKCLALGRGLAGRLRVPALAFRPLTYRPASKDRRWSKTGCSGSLKPHPITHLPA